MLVMKFGGTSLADASRFKDVLDIVGAACRSGAKLRPSHTPAQSTGVIVLSAMSGVTNGLIACAQEAQTGSPVSALDKLNALKAKHMEVINELFSDATAECRQLISDVELEFNRLAVLLQGIAYLGELSKRSLDAISGTGEILSTRIFSVYANKQSFSCQYIDARSFIVTNNDYGRAVPNMPELVSRCQSEILPVLKKGNCVITQGFIGSTADGVMTTLGRGGSDYSAALIGAALEADEIQIWTDVDGMMTADPRLVRDAQPIAEVSFQEAAELAYFGAKVLHPLTIKPAIEKNIPVRILNTLNPKSSGTLIMNSTDRKISDNDRQPQAAPVCAIASKKGLAAVFINTPRMLMATGFIAEVFAVFARHETPIDLVATSEISISLTVDRFDHLPAIEKDLKELGEVSVVRDLAIVSVVGSELKKQTGIVGQIFKSLADIDIVMISYGASEINLNFVVAGADADKAVKLLHAEFFPALVAHCAPGI